MSPSVPASLAAWYLALHCLEVRPLAASSVVAAFLVLVAAVSSVDAVSAPWALRNSFQFMPLSVSASLAAWYLTLHSLLERALAGAAAKPTAARAMPARAVRRIIFIEASIDAVGTGTAL